MVNANIRSDLIRAATNLLAAPLIWICSSLGFFIDGARSPSGFSDLTANLLVPQTTAFSIWLPIFIGIMTYSVIQSMPSNLTRDLFRQTGWWVAGGLWGIIAWGLVTAFVPDSRVEEVATLVFIPAMCALVVATVRLSRRRQALNAMEKAFVLTPISLIAGWCSIAVFIGLNGLIWSHAEGWGWSNIGTALSVLGLALWWIIYVLRQGAINKAYAFPCIWGLSFLALRHFGQGGFVWIGAAALVGIVAIILACVVKTDVKSSTIAKH